MSKITFMHHTDSFHDDTVGTPRIGKIVDIDERGCPMVDFQGNPLGPIRALSTVSIPINSCKHDLKSTSVLLLFQDEDLSAPIIIGVIRDSLFRDSSLLLREQSKKKPKEVTIDGEQLIFEANKEILLRCGKGSIAIYSDGTIVVKGTQITSRASGRQKIRGSSVNIN
jgi:hypothetical protein